MAYTSVTYTFTNGAGQTIDATQVNQNFTDIINGLSDGTKDLNIRAAVLDSNLTVGGSAIIGDAITDTIQPIGRFIADIIPLSDNLRDLGTSALRFAEIHGVSARIAGAELLKTYTYSHTLDAADIIAGSYQFTVTSVDQTKIRVLHTTGYDLNATNVYSTTDAADALYTAPALTSATLCTVVFGATYAVGDIISLTIVEAV